VVAPYIIRSSALSLAGAVAPSERITVGLIGAGGRMGAITSELSGCRDAQQVAVCDVYAPARQRLSAALNLPAASSYRDFRDLLARTDIDAVAIATPDHWHVLLSIAAVKAGKDVYCEKPLSNTVAEGRALADVVARYRAVFQHGTQLHSLGEVRQACELVRNGRIGKLHTVRIGSPPGVGTGPQPAQPVPAELDYDLWLGPAPEAPFTPARVFPHNGLPGWYFVSDYSLSGWIAGYGVHDLDIAHWGMDTQRTGPVTIEGSGVFPTEGLFDTVLTYDLEFTYASGVRLIMTDTGKHPHGVRFEGTDGWVFTRSGIDAEPKSLLREKLLPQETHLYRSPGHVRNFLDCVKTRAETATPAEVAHRATSAALLGGIAIRLRRKLRWDPQGERFLNDDEANRMLGYTMREPWRL
jgi:predicted dehydrogenase